MAKRSLIENNNAKRRLVASKEKTRSALKAIIKNKDTSFEERIAASHKLAQMPRNSSATRIRNRCEVSGRPRGFYRKFKISRIALRELSSNGLIPGVTKASW